MIQEPSELDLAQLRSEMRQLYRHIGFGGCLQVLYEIMKGGEILTEIMLEERANERRDASGNA